MFSWDGASHAGQPVAQPRNSLGVVQPLLPRLPLDLPAMVARGLGDRPLAELPFMCRACGSFGLICPTGHTGPAWSALRPQRQ